MVLGAAFDEANARAAWVEADGAVVEWRAGQPGELLAGGTGPDLARMRRVYKRDSYLLFAADDALWRYELADHRWQQVSLRFSGGVTATLDINVEGDPGAETVTARVAGDRWYVGQFTPPEDSVSMSPLLALPTRTFAASANDLLDVSEGAGSWTFLLADRLKYFDPAERSWSDDVLLGGSDTGRTLQRALGRLVAVGNGGRSWWVAQTAGDRPSAFVRFDLPQNEQVAIDDAGAIWRLNGNAELSRCAVEAASYVCRRANDAPMALAEPDVRRAYTWQGLTIFDTAAGLRAFDPKRATEVAISGATRLAQASSAREYQGRLLVHDGATLVALERDGDTILARSWSGVNALIFDADDVAWARFGSEWRRAAGDDWAAPRLSDQRSVAEAGAQVFVTEGGEATAVDRAGTLYRWTSALAPDALRLPSAVAPGQIDLLLAGAQNDWWLRSGGRLSHLAASTCAAAPTPTATVRATATPAITRTMTPSLATTPTALPASPPTATPRPVPCLMVRGGVDLPSGFQNPALPRRSRDRRQPADDHHWQTASRSRSWLAPPVPPIASARHAALRRSLPGSAATNGPACAATSSRSRVVARPLTQSPAWRSRPMARSALFAPAAASSLRSAACFQPSPTAALDAGWLRWERGSGQFLVAGAQGPISLRKDQFIVGGALIVEPLGALLAETPDRFHIANQHGVWSFDQADAELDDASLRYTPLALSSIVGAAHGRFLAAGGDLPPGPARSSRPEPPSRSPLMISRSPSRCAGAASAPA